ncbi:MAG: DNA mismatch repair protein MutS, partial [Candidatus Zixiibacteriota bacterium]
MKSTAQQKPTLSKPKKAPKKPSDRLTPLLRQYYSVKAKHPDKIVFFRMGDFFEMFGDDAIKAAPILGVALTRRGQAGSEDLPLCGVPHHAADKYLAKLLSAGEKVALVEQVEDPKTAKGVVKREVVEILTPGSATLDSLEESSVVSYLAAVRPGENGLVGLSYLELSTAEFRVYEAEASDIAEKLGALNPREVIVPEGVSEKSLEQVLSGTGQRTVVSRIDGYHFDIDGGAEALRRFFKVTSLEGFGVSEQSMSIGAASAIVNYLRENHRNSLEHIRSLSQIQQSETMELDSSSIRNLELVEGLTQSAEAPTLFGAVNLTLTAPGARRLRRNLLAPFRSQETILLRQGAVEEALKRREVADSVRSLLKSLCDLERLAGRLGMRRLSPRQAQGLAQGAALGADI